mgnify:CR=1 FL=1
MGLVERREKERNNRRNLILKSARTLFLEKGFKSVTVDKIARHSELGKGSIYFYFNSKEEIYAQVLLNDINKFHQQAFALLENKKSATDLFYKFSHFYTDIFLNDRELFRILMTYMLNTERMKLPVELDNKIIIAMNRTIDAIGRILQIGIEEKEFPPNINLIHSQYAIWGLLNGIISLHIFSGSEVKRPDRIRSTIDSALEIFIAGLKRDREVKKQ